MPVTHDEDMFAALTVEPVPFPDFVQREVERLIRLEVEQLETDLTLALAYTPVERRCRLHIVEQVGIPGRRVACVWRDWPHADDA